MEPYLQPYHPSRLNKTWKIKLVFLIKLTCSNDVRCKNAHTFLNVLTNRNYLSRKYQSLQPTRRDTSASYSTPVLKNSPVPFTVVHFESFFFSRCSPTTSSKSPNFLPANSRTSQRLALGLREGSGVVNKVIEDRFFQTSTDLLG